MALTSGNRQLLREAASWAVVALIGAAAFSHFETLKTGAEQLLGLPTPSDVDARTTANRRRHGSKPRALSSS
jgi:aspartyl protease family protein